MISMLYQFAFKNYTNLIFQIIVDYCNLNRNLFVYTDSIYCVLRKISYKKHFYHSLTPCGKTLHQPKLCLFYGPRAQLQHCCEPFVSTVGFATRTGLCNSNLEVEPIVCGEGCNFENKGQILQILNLGPFLRLSFVKLWLHAKVHPTGLNTSKWDKNFTSSRNEQKHHEITNGGIV